MHIPTPGFCEALGPWRRSFAYLPTRTWDDEWLWLKPVMRRRVTLKPFTVGGPGAWWQYAKPTDMDKKPS